MAFNPFQYLDDDITTPANLVSFEAFGASADNVNYLMAGMSVGRIVPIMDGFPGVPPVDLTIWKECDGSVVDDENSPLHGQAVPDYSDLGRYMRGYTIAGQIGQVGGANEKDLTHSHGGQTARFPPFLTPTSSDDNNASAVVDHAHSVAPSLGVTNFEPEHYVVKHYMKIR